MRKVEPEYPKKFLGRRKAGIVALKLTVTKTGVPTEITVVKSLDPDLDKSAVAAVNEVAFSGA